MQLIAPNLLFLVLLTAIAALCEPEGDQVQSVVQFKPRSLGEPEPSADATLPSALVRLPLERSMSVSALFTQHDKLTTVVIYFDPYSDPYWTEETEICMSWVIGLPLINSTDHQCNFVESNKCISSLQLDPCKQTIRAPSGDCEKDHELISGFARINSYYPTVTPISQFNTTIHLMSFWADRSIMMAYSSKKKGTTLNQRLVTCGNPRLGHGGISDFHYLDEQPPVSRGVILQLSFWRTLNWIYALFIPLFLL